MDYIKNHTKDDISDYMKYHDALDQFIWLIKLMYAPKSIIKNKRYKVDELFQYYLNGNNFNIEKFKKYITNTKKYNRDKIVYYVKQGWYNELAASYPSDNLKNDLNMNINLEDNYSSWKTELFPTWTITQTYYSIYCYYISLLFTSVDNINTYQHRNPTNHFNNTLAGPFSKLILFYPFNIVVNKNNIEKIYRTKNRKEWQYKYAHYPRKLKYQPMQSIDMRELNRLDIDEKQKNEIFNSVYEQYKKIRQEDKKEFFFEDIEKNYISTLYGIQNKLKTKSSVNIVDMMYMFRTWSNYTGSDTFINLKTGGYLKYLQKNLYALNYFLAGIAELSAISFLGQDEYIEIFGNFYNTFINERTEIKNNYFNLSLVNRMRIYQHRKYIVNFDVNIFKPQFDNLILI